MGIIDGRISISPYLRMLAIIDLLSLGEHDLVRDSILLIRLVVVLERILPILNPQLLRNFYIESRSLAIDISILLGLEGLGIVGLEDGQPLNHKLIG